VKKITSESNPLIKEYVKILNGKSGNKDRVAVEGFNLIEEAIQQGFSIETLFYSPGVASGGQASGLLNRLPAEVNKVELTERVFKKIAQTENPQGAAAVIACPDIEWEKVINQTIGMAVLADKIQDPGNMGTIMRSLAAAGGSTLFYTPGTVSPFNHKVLRASAGTIFHIWIKQVTKLEELFTRLKSKGFISAASEVKTGSDYYNLDLTRPLLLAVGNERWGVSDEIKQNCEVKVNIPLARGVDSLNAAVAVSVILFEARRQRSAGLKR